MPSFFGNACLRHGRFRLGFLQVSTSFNTPNDVASFYSVTSTLPFDKVEILENVGGIDNEFFGRFYTATAIPEPATIIIWSLLGGLGIAVAHLRRRKAA